MVELKSQLEIIPADDIKDGQLAITTGSEWHPSRQNKVVQRYGSALVFIGEEYASGFDVFYITPRLQKFKVKILPVGALIEITAN